MRIRRLRRKLRKRIASRDRQFEKFELTGKKGHEKAAMRHQRAIIKLRRLIEKATVLEISNKGLKFIGEFEGFYDRPYNDPVGYATVGYGHLIGYRPVQPQDKTARWVKNQKTPGVLTKAEALELLRRDLNARYEPAVRGLFRGLGPLRHVYTQGLYDALVSFAYNLGPGSVLGAPGFETMGRAIAAGSPRAIADAMLLYDKAGGRALPGLTRRRRAEADMVLGR